MVYIIPRHVTSNDKKICTKTTVSKMLLRLSTSRLHPAQQNKTRVYYGWTWRDGGIQATSNLIIYTQLNNVYPMVFIHHNL